MIDWAETRLQMASADYLLGEIHQGKNVIKTQKPFPDLLFTHPVNEFKDETEAFWAVRKGIRKGANDWLFWWPGNNFGCIELKVNNKKPTPEQARFQALIVMCGGKAATCYTVAEVRDTLISWGLECKNMAVVEPRLPKAEIQRRYMDMLKPIDLLSGK